MNRALQSAERSRLAGAVGAHSLSVQARHCAPPTSDDDAASSSSTILRQSLNVRVDLRGTEREITSNNSKPGWALASSSAKELHQRQHFFISSSLHSPSSSPHLLPPSPSQMLPLTLAAVALAATGASAADTLQLTNNLARSARHSPDPAVRFAWGQRQALAGRAKYARFTSPEEQEVLRREIEEREIRVEAGIERRAVGSAQ